MYWYCLLMIQVHLLTYLIFHRLRMTRRMTVKQRRRWTILLTKLLVSRAGKQRKFTLHWYAASVVNNIVSSQKRTVLITKMPQLPYSRNWNQFQARSHAEICCSRILINWVHCLWWVVIPGHALMITARIPASFQFK